MPDHEPTSKSFARVTFGWLVAVAIVAVFVFALFRERETLVRVGAIGIGNLMSIAGCTVISIYITGITTRLYLKVVDVPLSVSESFWIAAANVLCGYLPMQVNLLVRAKYLKHYYSLDYASYTAMVVVNLFVMFQAIGIYGLIATAVVSWLSHRWNITMMIVFAALIPLTFIAARLTLSICHRYATANSRMARLIGGIRRFGSDTRRMVLAVSLTVLALAVYSARFYFAASQLSATPRMELASLLSPVATLTMYLALTPNGLGLRELLSGGMSHLLQLAPASGMAVATVERAGSVIAVSILGAIGIAVMATRTRTTSSRGGEPQ